MKQHFYNSSSPCMTFNSIEVCKILTRVCVLVIAVIGFSVILAGCATEDVGSTSPSATSTREHPDHPKGKDHPSKRDHPDHPSKRDHPEHPSNGDHPDHPSNGDHPGN